LERATNLIPIDQFFPDKTIFETVEEQSVIEVITNEVDSKECCRANILIHLLRQMQRTFRN